MRGEEKKETKTKTEKKKKERKQILGKGIINAATDGLKISNVFKTQSLGRRGLLFLVKIVSLVRAFFLFLS